MQTLRSKTKNRARGKNYLQRCQVPLEAVTFLAPKLLWFYQFLCRYFEKRLRYPVRLSVGSSYRKRTGREDLAFICGLPYVELTGWAYPRFEPIAAPILQGERYGGKPIYFSDVIARRDNPLQSFACLRGRSWAYNELHSQSGYGITRFHLVQRGETTGYFSKVVEAGYHERAIQMVCSGEVDASAIDSHLLTLVMRDEPALASRLRVIDTLGPSPIQPIVAAGHLSKNLKGEVQAVLLEMADNHAAQPWLDRALVKRFEQVSDTTYHRIRQMRDTVKAAQFLMIR